MNSLPHDHKPGSVAVPRLLIGGGGTNLLPLNRPNPSPYMHLADPDYGARDT